MARYHINKNGVPAICHAQPGKCPLGGANEHYPTKEAAQEAEDKKMLGSFLNNGFDSETENDDNSLLKEAAKEEQDYYDSDRYKIISSPNMSLNEVFDKFKRSEIYEPDMMDFAHVTNLDKEPKESEKLVFSLEKGKKEKSLNSFAITALPFAQKYCPASSQAEGTWATQLKRVLDVRTLSVLTNYIKNNKNGKRIDMKPQTFAYATQRLLQNYSQDELNEKLKKQSIESLYESTTNEKFTDNLRATVPISRIKNDYFKKYNHNNLNNFEKLFNEYPTKRIFFLKAFTHKNPSNDFINNLDNFSKKILDSGEILKAKDVDDFYNKNLQ